ncbi:MAG: RDD family protein [Solirubrobacteraceae bacterium]|nr:RDD family protein [Solirubrobacteraceae bacterium]
MTQPPTPEPKPSIYTRLDGSPLYQPQQPFPTGFPQPAGGAVDVTVGAPAVPTPFPGSPIPPVAVARQEFVLATWGSRLGAYLIDAFLFGILAWIVLVPVGVALGLTVNESAEFFARLSPLPESIAEPTPFYVAVAFQALIPGIALAMALLRLDGQSPGKRAVGIRVVRADGLPLDSRTAFRRELAAKTILMALVLIFTLGLGWLLNYLWPLWDKEHRAGHDMLVGTRVVQAPKVR